MKRTASKKKEPKLIETRRMWDGGPLRKLANFHKNGRWVFLDKFGLYGGPYVCDDCGAIAAGIYKLDKDWLCGSCKRTKAGVA